MDFVTYIKNTIWRDLLAASKNRRNYCSKKTFFRSTWTTSRPRRLESCCWPWKRHLEVNAGTGAFDHMVFTQLCSPHHSNSFTLESVWCYSIWLQWFISWFSKTGTCTSLWLDERERRERSEGKRGDGEKCEEIKEEEGRRSWRIL